MPFGLTTASSTFQILINKIFRPHVRYFVLVLFDNILIYIKSWEEHIKHVDKVLQFFDCMLLAEKNAHNIFF